MRWGPGVLSGPENVSKVSSSPEPLQALKALRV